MVEKDLTMRMMERTRRLRRQSHDDDDDDVRKNFKSLSFPSILPPRCIVHLQKRRQQLIRTGTRRTTPSSPQRPHRLLPPSSNIIVILHNNVVLLMMTFILLPILLPITTTNAAFYSPPIIFNTRTTGILSVQPKKDISPDEPFHDPCPLSSSSSSSSPSPSLDRRSMITASSSWVAAVTTTSATTMPGAAAAATPIIIAENANNDDENSSYWPLWTALPVAPYANRKTIRQQVAPGVWTFDQLIGIYYVHVPIRMTVIALSSNKDNENNQQGGGGGGLFVYAPIAPTKECLSLLQPLIADYGPIRYIVLPSVAVEHKVLAGPFARAFPTAEFYVTSKQYAFPINLPDRTLGFPSWTKRLPATSSSSSTEGNTNNNRNMWNNDLEHEVLDIKPGPGSEYQDAAFYHKASKTLLICDALIAVHDEPPAILTDIPEYTRALLFHARDAPLDLVDDTPEARRKGWRRIVLLFNFFFPGAANADLGLGPLLALRPSYRYGWGGWLPFSWKSPNDERIAFDRYSNNGTPTIFPIIQIIISRGNSGQVLQEWVDKVQKWDFERVVPAHLDAPLNIGPREFVKVFSFLQQGRNDVRFCDEDVAFLRKAEESFLNFSVFQSSLGTLRGPPCGLSK